VILWARKEALDLYSQPSAVGAATSLSRLGSRLTALEDIEMHAAIPRQARDSIDELRT